MVKDWEEIFYSIADGNIAQIEVLKGTKEVDFYNIMDLHKAKIERIKSSHNGK